MASVLSPISFVMWGADIVGIQLTSSKQEKYCIVVIDYMTKWVEAHLLAIITEEVVKKFMLEQKFSSVGQPQGNGVIEGANKIIFEGIKKRPGEAKGLWAAELPWVLWAYRTTPRSSTGETPFRLASKIDALLPVEVILDSYRTEVFSNKRNKVGLRANTDLLEEEREVADQRNLKYQLQAAQYYDSGVKKCNIFVGDLVLRELATSKPTKQGKLQPTWEGPYLVAEVIKPGTYKAATEGGEATENEQNVPKPKSKWTDVDIEAVHQDNKAMNIMLNGLDQDMFDNVINCKTAKNIWDQVQVLCKGTE
ncbi:uncharacterized protein LOC141679633 [Apium graveolens]|uniref:uncharacterized protein LOC141679633 n=1 Tax=Apium graveolens TaxID=4045 RepID=UPI003D7B8864